VRNSDHLEAVKLTWNCAEEELAAARQTETERQRYQELFEFAPDAYLVTNAVG